MKKFLLSFYALLFVTISNAQTTTLESFSNATLPAGWVLSNGIQLRDFSNPTQYLLNPANGCFSDRGLETPGVGGNNPAKILTPSRTFSSTAGFVNVGFTIYIFDSNGACTSVKELPCATFVQAYLVRATYNSTSTPPASEILGQSQLQIVRSNQANFLFVPGNQNLVSGVEYRVLYDFSVDGTCNQGGTKYVLDNIGVITTSTGPLPVTLKSFEAAQKSGKVSLTWNTMLELNNDGFEIERKIGNGAYQKIAFVDSKAPGGNGDAYSYSFDDNTALPKGVTYYRLKQIDFDGRSTYSEIRAVRSANGTLLLSVYPNPSRGTTNVAIPSGVGTVDVTLTDFTGKTLQQWNGLNTSNLQITNLKAGMYSLRVSVRATGETITERISVQ